MSSADSYIEDTGPAGRPCARDSSDSYTIIRMHSSTTMAKTAVASVHHGPPRMHSIGVDVLKRRQAIELFHASRLTFNCVPAVHQVILTISTWLHL